MAICWLPVCLDAIPADPVPVPSRLFPISKLLTHFKFVCWQSCMEKLTPKCLASFAVYCDRGGDILRCKCQNGYAGHFCERSVTELSRVLTMLHGVRMYHILEPNSNVCPRAAAGSSLVQLEFQSFWLYFYVCKALHLLPLLIWSTLFTVHISMNNKDEDKSSFIEYKVTLNLLTCTCRYELWVQFPI